MKNLKTNQFVPSLLFCLFAMLMVACGDMGSASADTPGGNTDTETPVDKVDGSSTDAEDQEIHVLERSEHYIDVPHFCHFDIAHWELAKDDKEGDTAVKIYTMGNMILELDETDAGDGGFSQLQTLKNAEGELIKKREFSYIAAEEKLVEAIYDYHSGMKRTLEQKMDGTYDAKNKPRFIEGDFKESKI